MSVHTESIRCSIVSGDGGAAPCLSTRMTFGGGVSVFIANERIAPCSEARRRTHHAAAWLERHYAIANRSRSSPSARSR